MNSNITFCIYILFFQPILEYFIHLLVHKYTVLDLYDVHKKHHLEIHHKTYKNSITEIAKMQLILLPLLYFKYGLYAWISFLRYNGVHMILHIHPNVFPKLKKHHDVHHINPKRNLSFTCIFPDKLFRTIEHT